MAKTPNSPATPQFVALGIYPSVEPRLYHLVKLTMAGDKVIDKETSESVPFHIAVYRQKMEAAKSWT